MMSEQLLQELSFLYERALSKDNLALAFKIKECEAKTLGMFSNEIMDECLTPDRLRSLLKVINHRIMLLSTPPIGR